jgi:steroid delta-isomerase-like uncharacterized protein
MAAEANKALVRRAFEIWNRAELAAVGEIVSADYARHDPATPGVRGVEGLQQLIASYHEAFPDLRLTIEDLLAEGETVAARWSGSGTHRGALMGIPPTGRQTAVSGIGLYRLAGGKIAEEWESWDALGLMQQLGAVPAPGQAPA